MDVLAGIRDTFTRGSTGLEFADALELLQSVLLSSEAKAQHEAGLDLLLRGAMAAPVVVVDRNAKTSFDCSSRNAVNKRSTRIDVRSKSPRVGSIRIRSRDENYDIACCGARWKVQYSDCTVFS
jgi:hypothetical protein